LAASVDQVAELAGWVTTNPDMLAAPDLHAGRYRP
jgi:hypothetical protein